MFAGRDRSEGFFVPFTLSHPAAVLPLLRRPFVPAALVAGAMAPDLPYFVKVPVTAQSWYEPFVNATFSHTPKGMLLVGIPSVLLLVLLFLVVRRPLADLLPFRLSPASRGAGESRGPAGLAFWFLVSALIGLATHVVWDSITHDGSLLGVEPSFLRADLPAGLTVSRFLQHASTILGGVIIVVWFLRRVRSDELSVEWKKLSRSGVARRLAVVLVIVAVSVGFAANAVMEVRDRDGALGLELVLATFLKSGMPVAAVCVAVYALAWQLTKRVAQLSPR